MRRISRWPIFTAVVLVLALAALASFAIATVRTSFPETSGRLMVSGLSGQVEVLRDSYGVPHIYADNPEDLFEAQGYVHAQDRFFEMDFRRHLAAGRLSELFGISQLETDAYIRTLGWRRVAEQELSLLAPSTRRYLDAYAAGVNAYLAGRSAPDLSLEYSLLRLQGLRYTPEAWTAVDSVAWLKVMAWDLSSNLTQEADRAIITGKIGGGRAASLFPTYPLGDDFAPIVRRGDVVGKAFDPTASRSSARPLAGGLSNDQLRQAWNVLESAAKINEVVPHVLGSASVESEIGSNSWAVAGSHTESGKAILSNDPHLATSIPSAFAQVGLHCRTVSVACRFDVSGFSMASMPGVVIGKNNKIAWGATTSYIDSQDLYLEDVRGDTVRQGDRYVPLRVITEEIHVRGEDQPKTIRIRSSRHGPLLSDVDQRLHQVSAGRSDPNPAQYAVALSWTALQPGRSMDALMAIDRAQNFGEFREAAALLSAPSQNLIYADTDGNIGYQLSGTVPHRRTGNGKLPSPGWDIEYDWRGTIPFAKLPYVYNPPSGFLVAANQQVIGAQYPYPLGSTFSYGWRSQEIIDRLRDAPPLTLDSAEPIFYDDTIRFAADLVPILLKIKVPDPWVVEGQRTLVGWDYSAAKDSAAAAYFNVICHNIFKLTFRDELPEEDLWPTGGDRWYAVLTILISDVENPWWDDVRTPDKIETRDEILLAAMTNARKEITSLMARDTDQWQWGKLHTVQLKNPTLGKSGIKPIERLFNRGGYQVGGGPAVVNAMAFDDRKGYVVTSGPTMRMLVDLGDLDASRWVNQSGVSGHAFHRHYDDQTELWANQRLWPFVSSRGAVEARSDSRQELLPSG
ncbi:MAG TPA: penicillin acylase family protein [Propionibacteriaceae bacterium]|nr:penicillin acylase family protein [Propionibacteriaceae bacterium]